MFLEGFLKSAANLEASQTILAIRKPKLKFDPNFDQVGFQNYVLLRSDHIPETGYAVGQPKDFTWSYEPKMSLKFSDGIKKDWVGWFNGEQEEWQYNHGKEERAGHFEKWMKDPEKKPIVLVEGLDGKLHLWDGHHRVGMAHAAKMKTVPAILGKRNKEKKS